MKSLNLIFTGVLMLGLAGVAMAQPSPPATPIDGGLSLVLIATGAAIGIKKLKKK